MGRHLRAERHAGAKIVSTLNGAIEKAASSEQFKTAITNLGLEPAYLNATDFAKFWADDAKRVRRGGETDRPRGLSDGKLQMRSGT